MNKIAKMIVFPSVFFVVALVYLVLLYGFNRPLERLEGCYAQDKVEPIDKICIYEGGKYEQFSQNDFGEDESYNTGDWRRYSASVGGDKTVGVTLSSYFDRFEDRSEMDIFPYRNMFGKSLFVVGPLDKQRFYISQ